MKISACIISKNEEKNIGNCLESIKNVADEIIVVDTGSNDNTVNIAKSYNAKVYNLKWEDDFSKARNKSIELAKNEWILIIDCDEILDKNSESTILSVINCKDIDAFGIEIINIINNEESSSNIHLRLFRNNKGYKYEGIIHEQIKLNGCEDISAVRSYVKFIHYGYGNNDDLEIIKRDRNLKLLNLVKEDERDSMYYLHLGAEYTRVNEHEKASTIFIKGYNICNKNQPHFTQLAQKLVDSIYLQGEYNKCINYCNDILNTHSDFKCIYFTRGASYLNLKNYEQALINFKMYNHLDEKPLKYPIVRYDLTNDIVGLINQLEGIVYKV